MMVSAPVTPLAEEDPAALGVVQPGWVGSEGATLYDAPPDDGGWTTTEVTP